MMEQADIEFLKQFRIDMENMEDMLRETFWTMEKVKTQLFDADTPKDLIRMGYHLSDLNQAVFDNKIKIYELVRALDGFLDDKGITSLDDKCIPLD